MGGEEDEEVNPATVPEFQTFNKHLQNSPQECALAIPAGDIDRESKR